MISYWLSWFWFWSGFVNFSLWSGFFLSYIFILVSYVFVSVCGCEKWLCRLFSNSEYKKGSRVFCCQPYRIFLLSLLRQFLPFPFLQCPHTNINEVLSSLLSPLLPGVSHIFLLIRVWYDWISFNDLQCFLSVLLCHIYLMSLRVFLSGPLHNISIYAASYPLLLEPIWGMLYFHHFLCISLLTFKLIDYVIAFPFDFAIPPPVFLVPFLYAETAGSVVVTSYCGIYTSTFV